MTIDYQEFIKSIKKVSSKRIHKVTNSYGVYDYFKYYRKNKPKDPKYILTESMYFTIIRRINTLIADKLTAGEDIKLPCRMGVLEVRKYPTYIKIVDGKLKTNKPIDWDKTLKLWYEDKESFNNKVLVKSDIKDIFRVHYNKETANYNNKAFYQFTLNRDLKLRMKQVIKNNELEAFTVD